MKSLAEQIASELLAVETDLKAKLDELKKTQKLLKTARGKIAKKTWPFGDARKLLGDLTSRMTGAAKEEVVQLHEQLKKTLEDGARIYERAFVDELVAEARKANFPCGPVSDTYFLGPFRLTLDFGKEAGVLAYADQPVTPAISLDAAKLVAIAAELVNSLLTTPTDIGKLASDFEEAIRVFLIRNKKPTDGRELRCPLPELHREMALLRQDRNRIATAKSFREYPLVRFVVELKTLVQSEQNLTAAKRFRLETAVIENTKNAKKSVFIPSDLQRGFGEGTYFQALVLVNEAP